MYGDNLHHINEAIFKSLALALKEAVKVEGTTIHSTRAVLTDERYSQNFLNTLNNKNYSENTLKAYDTDITQFIRFLRKKRKKDVQRG